MFKKRLKDLPNRALSDIDIKKHLAWNPHFIGVFLTDQLPSKNSKLSKQIISCGVLNLDRIKSCKNRKICGTHWTAFYKIPGHVEYFDSFGNLRPPNELVKFFSTKNIKYNYKRYQKFNTKNCGHLCISFINRFYNKYFSKKIKVIKILKK